MQNIWISGFSDEISSDLEEQLRVLRELGMTHCSLRGVGAKNICDCSMNEVDSLIKPLLDRYGIQVSSLGSPVGKIFADDQQAYEQQLAQLPHICALAKALDCRYVRIFSFYIPHEKDPAQYREIILPKLRSYIAVFKQHGIIALHENEKDIYGDTIARCKDLFDSIPNPCFAAIFDFANFVQCGMDTIEGYRLLHPYIRYFHIKDAVTDHNENVLCGTGEGQIDTILKLAIKSGYTGFLTLEPHLAPFDSLQSLELKDASEIVQKKAGIDGKTGFAMQLNALREILKEFVQ